MEYRLQTSIFQGQVHLIFEIQFLKISYGDPYL